MQQTIIIHNTADRIGGPQAKVSAEVYAATSGGETPPSLHIYFGSELDLTIWDTSDLDTTLALFDAIGIAVQKFTISRRAAAR